MLVKDAVGVGGIILEGVPLGDAPLTDDETVALAEKLRLLSRETDEDLESDGLLAVSVESTDIVADMLTEVEYVLLPECETDGDIELVSSAEGDGDRELDKAIVGDAGEAVKTSELLQLSDPVCDTLRDCQFDRDVVEVSSSV